MFTDYQKKQRRLVAWLLSLVMMLSFFGGINFQVKAADGDSEEAGAVYHYKKSDKLESGKEYVVAVVVSGQTEKVFALKNNGSNNKVGAVALDVTTADPDYVKTGDSKLVWRASETDGKWDLNNDGLNFYPNTNNGVIAYNRSRGLSYQDGKFYFHSSTDSLDYYVTFADDAFGISNDETNAATFYLFEKDASSGEIPIYRYEKASSFEADNKYVVAVATSGQTEKVYALKNNGSSNKIGAVTLDVTAAEPDYVKTDDSSVVWEAVDANGKWDLKNDGLYFYPNTNNGVIAYNRSRGLSYQDGKLFFHSSTDSLDYYVTFADDAFGISSDETQAATFLLFKEIVEGYKPVSKTTVVLNKDKLDLNIGEAETLQATVTPEDVASQGLTWSSDKESVATVVNGLVTAVTAGTAKITVKTVDGKKATCEVTVTDPSSQADLERFEMTDKLENGKEYLIINNDSVGEGSSRALKNTGVNPTTKVTISSSSTTYSLTISSAGVFGASSSSSTTPAKCRLFEQDGDTTTFKEVFEFTAGKKYIVAADASEKVYGLKTSLGSENSVVLSVTPASGSDPAYVADVDTANLAWTCTESSSKLYLVDNDGAYLHASSSGLSLHTGSSPRSVAYVASNSVNLSTSHKTTVSPQQEGDAGIKYIETADTNIIWTATAHGEGFYLSNDACYLEGSGSTAIISKASSGQPIEPSRYWIYTDENKLVHKGDSSDRTLIYASGQFNCSTSTSTAVYLYKKVEKTQVNKYPITWKNGDAVLEKKLVEEGTLPTYSGPTPTKEEDEQNTYTFKEWSPTPVEVVGEATYTAQYTATPKTTPEQALAAAKQAAKDAIDAKTANLSENYYPEAQEYITGLVTQYKDSIDAENDITAIETLRTEFETAFNAVPTKEAINTAKTEIETAKSKLLNQAEYNDVQKGQLDKLAADYKAKLEKATSQKNIEDISNEFSEAAGKVPAKKEIEAALAKLKEAVPEDVLKTYTPEQQKQITDLLAEYKKAVENAKDTSEIATLLGEFGEKLGKIAEGSKSVADAKTKASAEIDKAVSADNLAKYKTEEQAKIKELAAKYKDSIAKAASVDEVTRLLNEFNAEVAKLKTAAQYDQSQSQSDAALKAQVEKTAVKIKAPKAGKKKVTVKWTANKLFDGYQVNYKIKGKGKKWKKVTVKGATKSKKVIKKLKKGKKYQIKVRGYKTIAGAKVYGKFSKTKVTKKIK